MSYPCGECGKGIVCLDERQPSESLQGYHAGPERLVEIQIGYGQDPSIGAKAKRERKSLAGEKRSYNRGWTEYRQEYSD